MRSLICLFAMNGDVFLEAAVGFHPQLFIYLLGSHFAPARTKAVPDAPEEAAMFALGHVNHFSIPCLTHKERRNAKISSKAIMSRLPLRMIKSMANC